ncbi:hypothetical protein DMN91_007867 [Ooceraea biroi]|uniref:C2H2-type domain-containing protein n=1 Tax=Ooceraea biroi TaxID=2015173 RepID=A0A026X3R6_OOCBI|nr:zinc finger protein 627 [Ooceraea biroi]EZA62034.1 hypothetical protein X777_06720 [Ooceraea biroi]RLU19310.1 hypothetical protein DMN91_007867 [Ooceraea biroi]
MRRHDLKADEECENVRRKASSRSAEHERRSSKSHKRKEHAAGGRKSKSGVVDKVVHKVEPREENEETPIELLYLGKDPIASGVSCDVEMEPSVSNEDNYILVPPLDAFKDAELSVENLLEQSMDKMAKNQKNARWRQSYNRMVFLRKHAASNSNESTASEDISQSTSTDEHERIPKIEDITSYEDDDEEEQNAKSKRDKKWEKKLHPLSLRYTDKKRPYLKCPACGATFFSPNTYQRHLISHVYKTSESYACNFCNYSNAEPGMLFAHLTKHQNQCESCNESLLRKDNYEKHFQCTSGTLDCTLKRDHHGMFVCAVCELVFDLSAQLEKHWFKHTCKKQKSYQCNECSGLYENTETLKNHICLKCPICGEVYESLHRLKIHTMWTKHNLKCPICSYEFILSMDHEKHMALHRKVYQPMKDYMHCLRAADGKTFQCNLCDKIFYALPTLLTHLTEEHDVGNVKVEEEEEEEEAIMDEDDSYELKGDAIDIVVVPDFKDSDGYFDSCSDMDSTLQQETDLYDPS